MNAAFRGAAECEECGEEKTVHHNVRMNSYTIDECPECGAEDVEFVVIDGMEAV